MELDTVKSSDSSFSMGTVAKTLGTGRNRLFKLLRHKGILNDANIPFQSYIDRGYFAVKLSPKQIKWNEVDIPVTLVTREGVGFIEKLINESQ